MADASQPGTPPNPPRQRSRRPVHPAQREQTTIADVAQHAGVSKATVSLVLSERPGPSQATRERVRRAARDLGWKPSPQARALSTSRASAIGLVLARDPEEFAVDPFFPRFVAGVERTLARHEYALLLRIVANDATAEERAYRFMAHQRTDGVLLTDLRPQDRRFELLHALGLPAVAVGDPIGVCPFPAVYAHDERAVELLLGHLTGLGHRRIGHLGGPTDYVHVLHRAAAFDRRAAEPGLTGSFRLHGGFGAEDGARLTRDVLRRASPPTALLFDNDVMAMAGMRVIREAGLRVPQDVSLASLDRTPMADSLAPHLTGVTADVDDWGARAASTLLSALDGTPPARQDGCPLRLLVRGSTGPVAAGA